MSDTSVYQTKINAYISGKREASEGEYQFLMGLTGLIVLGGALINLHYGAEQGRSLSAILLLAGMYFLADFAMAYLGHRLLPRWLAVPLAWLSLLLFALLSCVSGASYMISQEHLANNAPIVNQEKYIRQLERDLETKPKTMPGFGIGNYNKLKQEIKDEKEKFDEMVEESGGYTSGSSAIYAYLETSTGIHRETISVCTRFLWIGTFVIGSLALGGLLGTTYTPSMIKRKTKALIASQRAIKHGEQRFTKALTEPVPENDSEYGTNSGDNCTADRTGTLSGTVQYPDALHYEAPIQVDPQVRLAVQQAIREGDCKPSVRSVKAFSKHNDWKVGTDQSAEILRSMCFSGHLERAGQGYRLI